MKGSLNKPGIVDGPNQTSPPPEFGPGFGSPPGPGDPKKEPAKK